VGKKCTIAFAHTGRATRWALLRFLVIIIIIAIITNMYITLLCDLRACFTCLFLSAVGYTMDVIYFDSLPDPVEVAKEELHMPQFRLVDWKVIDCSQNYTSGFLFPCCVPTYCFRSRFTLSLMPFLFMLFRLIFKFSVEQLLPLEKDATFVARSYVPKSIISIDT